MALVLMWAFLNFWSIRDYGKPIQHNYNVHMKAFRAVVRQVAEQTETFTAKKRGILRRVLIAYTVFWVAPGVATTALCLPMWAAIDSSPDDVETGLWTVGSIACVCCCTCGLPIQGVVMTLRAWMGWDDVGLQEGWQGLGWMHASHIFHCFFFLAPGTAQLPLAIGMSSGTLEVATVKVALLGFGLLPLLYMLLWLVSCICQFIHTPRLIPKDVLISEVAVWKVTDDAHYDRTLN